MNKQQLDQLFDLTDRVAIVTGGSRGIGRSIAEGFALAGAKVVIASRKPEKCDETVAAIEAAGGRALAVPTHMGELDQLEALAKKTLDHFGGIDILVNNAANALAMPFAEMTPEAWEKSMSVNLRGPVFLTQYCLPGLEKSGHGSIINVSSAGAFLFSQFSHIYAAAKAAMLSYVRSNAAEFASLHIRVNAIAPGSVDTDMMRNNSPEQQKVMAQASLMRRTAHPDELIGLALFLASDASSFVTGSTFHIDGGLVPR
jgi:NAD(P)-dependent dehydrogenase (short-subunit alcohol dehydrogenase family)